MVTPTHVDVLSASNPQPAPVPRLMIVRSTEQIARTCFTIWLPEGPRPSHFMIAGRNGRICAKTARDHEGTWSRRLRRMFRHPRKLTSLTYELGIHDREGLLVRADYKSFAIMERGLNGTCLMPG